MLQRSLISQKSLRDIGFSAGESTLGYSGKVESCRTMFELYQSCAIVNTLCYDKLCDKAAKVNDMINDSHKVFVMMVEIGQVLGSQIQGTFFFGNCVQSGKFRRERFFECRDRFQSFG